VETAGQKSLDEMTAERQNLLQNLGQTARKPAEPAPQSDSESAEEEPVRGLKMEKVEDREEQTSIPSSGVEWFASLFVLTLLALFFAGFKGKNRKN
jgi:cobaltochelatase CobN